MRARKNHNVFWQKVFIVKISGLIFHPVYNRLVFKAISDIYLCDAMYYLPGTEKAVAALNGTATETHIGICHTLGILETPF